MGRRNALKRSGCVTLLLQGEVNTSYQKRWFSLKGNLLFYRERRRERYILGVIVLERCTVQLCDSEELFAFSLSFYSDLEDTDGLRTYKFSAEDQASQESWVKALHSAHHGYLDLLVQDLRQQYLGKTSFLRLKCLVQTKDLGQDKNYTFMSII